MKYIFGLANFIVFGDIRISYQSAALGAGGEPQVTNGRGPLSDDEA